MRVFNNVCSCMIKPVKPNLYWVILTQLKQKEEIMRSNSATATFAYDNSKQNDAIERRPFSSVG